MGCDIHMHTEIKVNGKWLHFSQPRLERDYEMFGWLAGVRRDGTCLFGEPKGVPDDASDTTALCFREDGERCGAHTPSWIGAEEIERFYAKRKERDPKDFSWEHEQMGYLFGNGWDWWRREPTSYPKCIQDIRWVFWFDN